MIEKLDKFQDFVGGLIAVIIIFLVVLAMYLSLFGCYGLILSALWSDKIPITGKIFYGLTVVPISTLIFVGMLARLTVSFYQNFILKTEICKIRFKKLSK